MVDLNKKFRVPSVPNMPAPIPKNANFAVRIATPDLIVLSDDVIDIDIMADLFFESIGGKELISLVRNDIVSGQDVIYQPIKNLARIRQLYNPLNIIGLRINSESIFKNFSINLEDYIPRAGSGPNGERVYLDQETGNIVIDVINMQKDEEVEVQILRDGVVLSDTMYSNVILSNEEQY